jgi:hypothetical protein
MFTIFENCCNLLLIICFQFLDIVDFFVGQVPFVIWMNSPDVVLLASEAIHANGLPAVTLALGSATQMYTRVFDLPMLKHLVVKLILTDVPWGKEETTGYHTDVNWNAVVQGLSHICKESLKNVHLSDLNEEMSGLVGGTAGAEKSEKSVDGNSVEKRTSNNEPKGGTLLLAMGDLNALNKIQNAVAEDKSGVPKARSNEGLALFSSTPAMICTDFNRVEHYKNNAPRPGGHFYSLYSTAVSHPALIYSEDDARFLRASLRTLISLADVFHNKEFRRPNPNCLANAIRPISFSEARVYLMRISSIWQEEASEDKVKLRAELEKVNLTEEVLRMEYELFVTKFNRCLNASMPSMTFKHNCKESGCDEWKLYKAEEMGPCTLQEGEKG